MPRTARLVLPAVPHHIIQRGNRNQDVFFEPSDYQTYLSFLKDELMKAQASLVSYCLMTNHTHLIVVPHSDSLRFIGETHRRYTRFFNKKNGWRGHLWQDRFSSYPMDENYLYEAIRYIELNPVRAGICDHPVNYRWSSARQRISRNDAHDFKVTSSNNIIEDWETYWKEGLAKYRFKNEFDQNELSQNPLGNIKMQGGQFN